MVVSPASHVPHFLIFAARSPSRGQRNRPLLGSFPDGGEDGEVVMGQRINEGDVELEGRHSHVMRGGGAGCVESWVILLPPFFFVTKSVNNTTLSMLDQTETACVLAGVAAIGAIYVAHCQRQPFPIKGSPTECSARVGSLDTSGISARAATVATPEEMDHLWTNMSPEAEESMGKTAIRPPVAAAIPRQRRGTWSRVGPLLSIETTGAGQSVHAL